MSRWIGFVAQAALAVVLATACRSSADLPSPKVSVVSLDLATLQDRRAELDGRWVEFEAFMSPGERPNLLIPVFGRDAVQANGASATLCLPSADTKPVVVARGRKALRQIRSTRNGKQLVKVRAIYRNREYKIQSHWVLDVFDGFFEDGEIVSLKDKWCSSGEHPA